MNSLEQINRDEWAGKPYLIELRGGYYDGKRHHWSSLPEIWRQPEPAPLILTATEPSNADMAPISAYRNTGHVADDGAHIYQYGGHE